MIAMIGWLVQLLYNTHHASLYLHIAIVLTKKCAEAKPSLGNRSNWQYAYMLTANSANLPMA